MTFMLIPIGHVEKEANTIRLKIQNEFWNATTHLDLFSHIIVLWWIDGMDTSEARHTTLANPPKNKGPIPSGVFACRSPARPNPIGHSIVKIIRLDEEDKSILVDQIDANDKSPILDIKPYLPSSDDVPNARVAPWFTDLEKRYS